MFHGSEGAENLAAQAFRMAQLDNNHFVINKLRAYRGDITKRSELEFEAEFADGEVRWIPYSNDLFQTEEYSSFCERNPELILLKYRTDVAKTMASEINAEAIQNVEVGSKVFVELRQYGCGWYESLGLDDYEHRKYVIPFEYTSWKGSGHRKIQIESELTGDVWTVSNLWVKQFGSVKIFDANYMILIDEEFILKFPALIGETNREDVLARCREHLGIHA
jgi:hypothetical protein